MITLFYSQAKEGTFEEEPGSGAVAIVDQKEITVGTLDWLRRYTVRSTGFYKPFCYYLLHWVIDFW